MISELRTSAGIKVTNSASIEELENLKLALAHKGKTIGLHN